MPAVAAAAQSARLSLEASESSALAARQYMLRMQGGIKVSESSRSCQCIEESTMTPLHDQRRKTKDMRVKSRSWSLRNCFALLQLNFANGSGPPAAVRTEAGSR